MQKRQVTRDNKGVSAVKNIFSQSQCGNQNDSDQKYLLAIIANSDGRSSATTRVIYLKNFNNLWQKKANRQDVFGNNYW